MLTSVVTLIYQYLNVSSNDQCVEGHLHLELPLEKQITKEHEKQRTKNPNLSKPVNDSPKAFKNIYKKSISKKKHP